MMILRDGIRTGPAHELGLDSQLVCDFYRDHWKRHIALGLRSFYTWQFVEPPQNEQLDWNCVAVRDETILGVMGLNRRTFFLAGKPLIGAELTTWIVSEAARGLGIGKGIMESLQETYDYLAGFGISQMALPIYMMVGFRRLAQIPRYFKIYDEGAIASLAKVDQLGRRLASHWGKGKQSSFSVSLSDTNTLADIAHRFQNEANLFVRDAASLTWRYQLHPVYSYQLFRVQDVTEPGYGAGVVLRLDKTSDLKFLHLVDIFGDRKDMKAAVSFVETFAQDNNVTFVDVFASNSTIAAHFLAANWFSTNDDNFFQLAHLFYPGELRQPQTTSAAVWARVYREEAFDFGRLHLAKGDLDLDRPTIEYYEAHDISRA